MENNRHLDIHNENIICEKTKTEAGASGGFGVSLWLAMGPWPERTG